MKVFWIFGYIVSSAFMIIFLVPLMEIAREELKKKIDNLFKKRHNENGNCGYKKQKIR